ncbi:MAG: SpoIID/LytB domain-containing protein, partial [Candidatus Zixiibacteriota bacterium]
MVALIAFWSCGNINGINEEVGRNYLRLPFVRVLLDDTSLSANISSDHTYSIECLESGQQFVYHYSNPISVDVKNTRLAVKDNQGTTIHDDLDEVNIFAEGKGGLLRFGDKRYRGIIKVLPGGKTVQVINIVYLEDYLRGVVPPEIGERTPDEVEAVKAQAVAARTYAMAHLGQYPEQQYDIKSSIIDQVYDGYNIEQELVNRAIDATEGKVIFYQDEFINAYYHSTCGGMTDNIDHVWDRKESPYLKAVTDSGACSWSKYYIWREFFTESQLRSRIEQFLSSDRGRDFKINRIKDITILNRTPGGRVEELIVNSDNDFFSFKKDRIRWVIGRTSNPDLILPSDRFSIEIDRDGAGYVTGVTFTGRGYGHGVG